MKTRFAKLASFMNVTSLYVFAAVVLLIAITATIPQSAVVTKYFIIILTVIMVVAVCISVMYDIINICRTR